MLGKRLDSRCVCGLNNEVSLAMGRSMKPYRGWSELELFQAIGTGDGWAFQEFKSRLERCGRAVRSKMGGKIGEVDIEEIGARSLEKLEALRQRGFTGGNQEFRTYLYKVVASQSVEVMKETMHETSLDQEIELPDGARKPLREVAAQMIDPEWGALRGLEAKAERNKFMDAFERLDERCRKLLWQRHVEHRPEEEIANSLGMTLSNVWASVSRCRERLYRVLLLCVHKAGDTAWREKITALAQRLSHPSAEVFQLWWGENCSVKEIARRLQHQEREVKELLARAKAGVWMLAQETGN
jgi:RNA polymerase sigma factor (sigma-70 family)